MKREEFLKAFTEMSAEDQEAVRAELLRGEGTEAAGIPPRMKERMREMREAMKADGDPMAWCQQRMKGRCC